MCGSQLDAKKNLQTNKYSFLSIICLNYLFLVSRCISGYRVDRGNLTRYYVPQFHSIVESLRAELRKISMCFFLLYSKERKSINSPKIKSTTVVSVRGCATMALIFFIKSYKSMFMIIPIKTAMRPYLFWYYTGF